MRKEHDILYAKIGEPVIWADASRAPMIAIGDKKITVVDLDTGKRLRGVYEADARTGVISFYDDPPQLAPDKTDVIRHTATKRIRIFWRG